MRKLNIVPHFDPKRSPPPLRTYNPSSKQFWLAPRFHSIWKDTIYPKALFFTWYVYFYLHFDSDRYTKLLLWRRKNFWHQYAPSNCLPLFSRPRPYLFLSLSSFRCKASSPHSDPIKTTRTKELQTGSNRTPSTSEQKKSLWLIDLRQQYYLWSSHYAFPSNPVSSHPLG